MARIAGVNLPNKRIEIALTYVYGIGRSLSRKMLNDLNINIKGKENTYTMAPFDFKINQRSLNQRSHNAYPCQLSLMMDQRAIQKILCGGMDLPFAILSKKIAG